MKAIILDMDGLMIDSERLYFETERDIASKYGKEVKIDILKKLMGRSPKEAANIFIEDIGLPITPEEFISARDEIMKFKYKNELEPVPGLMELLNRFYSEYKMAIATGSPEKFLDIVIKKLELKKYFEVLQSSDKIKKGKPDPEIYLTVIKKLGVKASECIVLEDSRNGALAGKNAGCYTIAVYTEYTKDQDFSFTDYYAEDLFDASEHIKKISAVKNSIVV